MSVLEDVVTTVRQSARRIAAETSKSHIVQEALTWCGVENGKVFEHEIANVPIPGKVVVYFGDTPDKLYQLLQWLPVLDSLHTVHPVVLLFRRVESFRAIKKHTGLPRIFVRRFTTMMDVYEENSYDLVLYVNNGRSNFQSLEHPRPVHVHINHGESDKISMVSNKAKAYDYVFVAGPAAIERHKGRLVKFDLEKLVITGRPQLDLDFDPVLPVVPQRTVMYAPTWEGENEDNNYTSLDHYGPAIIRALLGMGGVRVIYKPHPRVEHSADPEVAAAHRAICGLIEEATGDHQVILGGNILAMFADVDALVTDISSVGLDYLYLHPKKPLILTDRRNDRGKLACDAPIATACPVIDRSVLGMLRGVLEAWIFEDDDRTLRERAREFYFGDLEKGASTERFLKQVSLLMSERVESLKDYRAWSPTTESA